MWIFGSFPLFNKLSEPGPDALNTESHVFAHVAAVALKTSLDYNFRNFKATKAAFSFLFQELVERKKRATERRKLSELEIPASGEQSFESSISGSTQAYPLNPAPPKHFSATQFASSS